MGTGDVSARSSNWLDDSEFQVSHGPRPARFIAPHLDPTGLPRTRQWDSIQPRPDRWPGCDQHDEDSASRRVVTLTTVVTRHADTWPGAPSHSREPPQCFPGRPIRPAG
ncbi:hypothetical protein XBLMG947_0440 [Xanthomonas bromi]|uniref:Uncharacterized protein n=1 Tax=Xanthomonas bromi TaxID=56449 RepID=A0A1C3NH26_9XANT|nr:hypothetical protein XBLMG947_0440 [Xanthomonas bromi]